MATKATTAVNLTPDSVAYIQALLDLGSIDGQSNIPDANTGTGTLKIHDNIRNLVYALYHILAGGTSHCSVLRPQDILAPATYTITITPGDKTTFDDLVKMEKDCTRAINDTNSSFSQKYKLVMEF